MATPRPVWNPDEKREHVFYDDWQAMPDAEAYPNGFRRQWEMFIRHVAAGEPWPYGLREGAKGLQLVEAAHRSWQERRFVDIPALPA
jgi:predicted dehydrogenase